MINGAKTEDSYVNPKGTVYITEGNGAVPGTGPETTLSNVTKDAWGRVHGTGGGKSASSLVSTTAWRPRTRVSV